MWALVFLREAHSISTLTVTVYGHLKKFEYLEYLLVEEGDASFYLWP